MNDDDGAHNRIVIYNQPESDKNNQEFVDAITVQQILSVIGASLNINAIHRLGDRHANINRPLVVQFNLEEDQINALKCAHKLNDFPEWQHVSLKRWKPQNERIQDKNITSETGKEYMMNGSSPFSTGTNRSYSGSVGHYDAQCHIASDTSSFVSQSSTGFEENDISKQIVIHNLSEQCGNETQREAADLCNVQLILLAINAWSATNSIKKVTRIGIFNPEEHYRQILVQFATEEDQKDALRNAHKLADIPQWKHICLKSYMPEQKQNPQVTQSHVEAENTMLKQQIADMQKQMALITQMQRNQQQQQTNFTNSASFNQEEHFQHQRIPSNNSFHSHTTSPPPPNFDSSPNFNTQFYLSQPEQPVYRTSSQTDLPQNNFSEMPPFQAYPQFTGSSGQPFHMVPPQQNFGHSRGVSPNESHANLQFGNMPQAPMHYQMPPFQNANMQIQPDMVTMMQNLFEQMKMANATAQKPPEVQISSESEDDEESEEEVSSEPVYTNELFKSQSERFNGPKTTLNILVLGETGVGKSTWINGIANYMSFDTLEDALNAAQPICLIPCTFEFYETNEDKIEVKLEPSHGERDANEVLSNDGKSATQDPKTYQFETSKYIVNIIDTPGIGDVRGVEQDKENTRKILNAVGQYKDLHAICFLFKANEARMTLNFRYCIGELLLQLHKDAVENIIFFFTNARGTFYKPGDTMKPLSGFLNELEKNRKLKIPLTKEKICCTDNEAFRLVCAYFNGAHFTEEDFINFAGSWKQSAAETHRFIEFAARQRPQHVSDILSINKARTIILHLAKPLADVNELIESNIKVFDDRKKDLQNTSANINELKKKLKIPQIGIEIKPLNYPKTVCTGVNCIETQKLPNTEQYQTIYKQICHDHCYLSGVDVERVPEPHLQSCAAMINGGQKCGECECPWSTHMHIRFDQIKNTVEVEDQNTKDLIKKDEDATVIKQKMIKDCENTVAELKAEQQKIIDVSLRFGGFLQANAIMAYNDAFEKYVEKSIEEEEKCIEVGGNRAKLENLKKLLAQYREEKKLLSEAAKNPNAKSNAAITADEVDTMKAQLFGLKHTGKTLEDLFKATGDGIKKNNNHITVKYTPPRKPQNAPQFGKYKKANKKQQINDSTSNKKASNKKPKSKKH